MKEKKKNNKTYALLVLGVLGAIALTLGLTYAYWRLTKEQTGVNVVNTDCFSIDFTGKNDITLNNAFPLDDTELESFLGSATPYHFTITNECSSLASATINLESLNANADKQLDDQWIDAILYETDYHKKLNKYTKLILNPNNDENKVIEDALHAYSLNNFTLKANEVKDFYLLLYMDQETPLQEDTKNATWKGKITLSAEYKVDQFANSGTLRKVTSTEEAGMWQYGDRLTKIVIETKKNKKESNAEQNAYGPFDESSTNDRAVESYVVYNFANQTWTGYLQGEGGIKLNSDSSYLFNNLKNVTEIEGLENLDTSNVTNMSYMFYNMSQLQTLDLNNFDTSNVTNMSYMFAGDYEIIYTSRVSKANILTTLNLSSFDTSKVKDMSYMFYNMSQLQNLTLGDNFNTSSVIDMSYMFGAYSYIMGNKLATLNLSSFDTSSVKDMSSMFSGMSQLQTLDLSNFDTSGVLDMNRMFSNDSKLTKIIYSPNFIHNDEANAHYMFYGCQANKPDATVHSSWEGVSFD